jgi:tetratricopeptide (TPR) repeat protein
VYCRGERTFGKRRGNGIHIGGKAGTVLVACLAAFACSRRSGHPQSGGPQTERIAILRFENLGADAATGWMGRAFSEVVTTELTGLRNADPISSNRMHALNQMFGVRPISAPGISTERTLALASGATRIGYGNYAVRGGRLEAELTMEDPRTGKTVLVVRASSADGDLVAVASDLGRQISPQTRTYGTRNGAALKAWSVALESADATAALQSLEAAIAADPDFGPPYRLLAQWRAQRQDRAGALSLLEQALSRGNRIPTVERARMEAEAANLRDDAAGRQRSLVALAQLEPRDAVTWRTLAETALSRRDFPPAIQAYQKSLEVEPESTPTWNQLGYAAAYAGDLNTALGALRHYQTMRPSDPDPLDSQGDVYLLSGHLREAEDFYMQAAKRSPGFPNAPDLFKAATARLMSGDVSGADGIAKQYTDARRAAHDPLAEYFVAEWWWVSGRRKQGYQQLAAFAEGAANGPLKEMASRAYAELALWSLFLGDRAAAERMVQRAEPLAGASSAALVMLARFLAQPPASPDEWAARATRHFPHASQNSFKETAVAYALLLSKEFQPASPILKHMYDHTSPTSDESARILLAWSRLETGQAQDAAPLLRLNPIPQLTGPGPLVSLYFPRIYYLRARQAAKDGKPDDARANYRLFLQLSGPDPLLWGEEKRAQAGQ